MNAENLIDNALHVTNLVTRVVTKAMETAESLQEFREQIAARAVAGDLDDAYYRMAQANQALEDFVDRG